MESILQKITDKTKERIAAEKKRIPVTVLHEVIAARKRREASSGKPLPDFLAALKAQGMSYICEVKRASPSKGLIAPDFPYLKIAKEYETAGAAAISCLTEPYWFLGSDRFAAEIAEKVNIPVLRKDFTVNEYMIYQTRAMGASAVLLICAVLGQEQLAEYLALTKELDMNALVEAHDENEVNMALDAGADIIGVNNRDLHTFTVDTANSIRLRSLAPPDKVFVSESGIKTNEDIRKLSQNGVNAVLIGETLMRSSDRKAALEALNVGSLVKK